MVVAVHRHVSPLMSQEGWFLEEIHASRQYNKYYHAGRVSYTDFFPKGVNLNPLRTFERKFGDITLKITVAGIAVSLGDGRTDIINNMRQRIEYNG